MDGPGEAMLYTAGIFFGLLLCIAIVNIIYWIQDSKKFKKTLLHSNMHSIEEFLQLTLSALKWEYIDNREMKACPITNDTEIMFVFREEEFQNYILSIEQKNSVFFELSYKPYHGRQITVTNYFDNSSNEHAFEKRYLNIMSTTLKIFSGFENKKTNKEKKEENRNHPIEKVKKEIEDIIEELKNSSHWLTEENKHALSYTYPHDIEQLFKTYAEVKQPVEVEEDMIKSLTMIQTSLQSMEIEVEKRKKEDIIKRRRIIETRV